MNLKSRWFHSAEFGSHDGEPYPIAWQDRLEALCSQLDVIRGAWRGPIRIVSGYRSPAWNERVDGAKASQHMEGRAADIQPMVPAASLLVSVNDMHARVLRLISDGQLPLIGGLGYYAGRWLHVDVRPKPADGHIAQWHGQGVGSEVA